MKNSPSSVVKVVVYGDREYFRISKPITRIFLFPFEKKTMHYPYPNCNSHIPNGKLYNPASFSKISQKAMRPACISQWKISHSYKYCPMENYKTLHVLPIGKTKHPWKYSRVKTIILHFNYSPWEITIHPYLFFPVENFNAALHLFPNGKL